MPTNDFKTVADGGSANVLSQAAYTALTSFLDNGFSTGIVPSNQFNKVLRQASVMSFVLAQFIANQSGNDVLDNGTPATILANLLQAVQVTANAQDDYITDTGSGNAYVVATVPVTASPHNKQTIAFRSTHANSGATTLNVGGGAVALLRPSGVALQSGDIVNNQLIFAGYETGIGWIIFSLLPSDFLDAPALRGVPTAPNPAPGADTTQIATTHYVQNEIAIIGNSSFASLYMQGVML